jgi:hypothetical protein
MTMPWVISEHCNLVSKAHQPSESGGIEAPRDQRVLIFDELIPPLFKKEYCSANEIRWRTGPSELQRSKFGDQRMSLDADEANPQVGTAYSDRRDPREWIDNQRTALQLDGSET